MAEKKSFMIYLDNEKQVNMLTDEQAGKLFKALFEFAKDGTETDFNDGMIAMAFSFMTDSIKRDTEKYESICQKRAENIKKRWNKKQDEGNTNDTNVYNCNFCNTNHTHIDKDKDIDKDKEIDINKRTGKPSPAPPKSSKKNFGEYGNVSLTDEQYSQLVKDYGEPVMNDYIRRMDEYIQMKGKKYKDFNLALRNWIKKDGITKGNDSYGRINKGIILD